MNVWLVRSGKQGERESFVLEEGLACIGWNAMPDLSKVEDKEEFRHLVERTYPDASVSKVSNSTGQLYAFAHRMEEGDIVAMPLKSSPQIALGKVKGPYKYRTDLDDIHHTRGVEWIRSDVSRTVFGQDLLYSLGAFMTVCKISRNNATERIQAILAGKEDPGYKVKKPEPGDTQPPDADDEEPEPTANVEELGRDQIRAHVEANFKGHDLARLVDAILQAEGYVTLLSPAGPDGGVDILARRGSMGFDGPKLCVQVKSSVSSADVNIFRGLQGTMQTFKAEEGLLVSWGGFNQVVLKEARLSFFSVRLWDSNDLLDAIQRNYDKLSEELQTELPLKRIWALVLEE